MDEKMGEFAIHKEGDRYVKRMIERKKKNTSPINQLQSVKTRITIFESLKSPRKSGASDHSKKDQLYLSYPGRRDSCRVSQIPKMRKTSVTSEIPRPESRVSFSRMDNFEPNLPQNHLPRTKYNTVSKASSNQITRPSSRRSFGFKENHESKVLQSRQQPMVETKVNKVARPSPRTSLEEEPKARPSQLSCIKYNVNSRVKVPQATPRFNSSNKENWDPEVYHQNPRPSIKNNNEARDNYNLTYNKKSDPRDSRQKELFNYNTERYPRDFLSTKPRNDENDHLPWDDDNINEKMVQQNRISVGKYFKAKSQTELLTAHNPLNETNESQSSSEGNRRESQQFFGPRVLSIIEPEVELQQPKLEATPLNRRRQSDLLMVQKTFKEARRENYENDDVYAETSPTDSDDNNLDDQRNTQRRRVNGYPKFNKLAEDVADPYATTTDDDNDQVYQTPLKTFTKNARVNNYSQPTTSEDTFHTITSPRELKSPNPEQFDETFPSISFFKRNLPVHESTRKFYDKTSKPQVGSNPSMVYDQTNTSEMVDCYKTARQEDTPVAVVKKSPQMPKEVENFLRTALGSECNSTVTENTLLQNKTDSNYNITDLMSEGEKSPVNRDDNKKSPANQDLSPRSVDSKTAVEESESKGSNALGVTRKIYRTLTKKFRQSFRLLQRQDGPSVARKSTVSQDPDRKRRTDELFAKSDIEEKRIEQACKAVDFCRTSPRFVAGQERLEAERILIHSGLTKSAMLNEIGRIACLKEPIEEPFLQCVPGRITLTDLSVSLREEQIRLRKADEPVEWFLVAVRTGLFVWVSHAVQCPVSGPLYFPGEVSIPDLSPDFKVTITIYSAVLEQTTNARTTMTGGYLEAYTIMDKIRFRKSNGKRRMSLQCIDKCKKSSFLPCGTVDLSLIDLKLAGPWTLNKVPIRSVVQGNMRLKMRCDLQLTEKHMGFLTYTSQTFFLSRGEQSSAISAWNRRWCVLKGQTLQLWNYPDEQETHIPIFSIDLGKCISDRVSVADRTMCARVRTLVVETCWRHNEAGCQEFCSHTRHFLRFDNNDELSEWQSKLNHVISSLISWNVIKK